MDGFNTCKLCFEVFEETNRPRFLHCGHTYCTNCLANLIKDGNLLCPRCKRIHKVTDARDFSINYDLEDSLSEAMKTQAHVSFKKQQSTKITKMETLIAEQRVSTHNLILAAKEMSAQVKGYDEFLLNKMTKHEEVLSKIRSLSQWHENIVKKITEERDKISKTQQLGEVCDSEVKTRLPILDNATNTRDAVSAIANLDKCFNELEGWIENCQEEFPNTSIVASEQVLMESLSALGMIMFEQAGANAMMPGLKDKDLSILEKITLIGNGLDFTLDMLRANPKQSRNNIASGRMYAVSSINGNDWYGKLSEKDGKMFLHSLQNQKPPQLAYKIKHTDIIGCLNKESTIAFLDLAWDGSFKGRILIHLYPDSSLTLHFRTLCTGDLGPSYAQTKFHEVVGRNESHELIRGGDYEHSTGLGGAQLFDLVRNEIKNCKNRECGVIYVTPNTGSRDGAQFTITTGSGINQPIHNIFGKVTEGLHVLKSAVRYENIREVEITDSGVILPF